MKVQNVLMRNFIRNNIKVHWLATIFSVPLYGIIIGNKQVPVLIASNVMPRFNEAYI